MRFRTSHFAFPREFATLILLLKKMAQVVAFQGKPVHGLCYFTAIQSMILSSEKQTTRKNQQVQHPHWILQY